MNQFHKGDLVRVKSAEQISKENRVPIGEEFNSSRGLAFLSVMWNGCGQETILDEQDDDSSFWWRIEFDLVENDGVMDSLLWDDEWLELVQQPVDLFTSDLEGLL